MPTSRRTFIRQAIAFGPVVMTFWVQPSLLFGAECNKSDPDQDCTLPDVKDATRFIPNEPTVGVRLSAAEMANPSYAKQLQNFRDAICLVRNIEPGNLISWSKLVAQHCIRCASNYPSNVHYDWQFPTWHRAFLYMFERQLRIMSNNDALRLVYWDWENPNSRVLPDIYKPEDQPLYWKNRYLGPETFPLKDAAVDVQGHLSLQTFEAFGGTSYQNAPRPALYTGPHANVHNAFADPDEKGIQGDMADLQHSPRDPVFFAHHGNIDRLWASWNALGRKNPDFGDAKVYFFDEKQKWRYLLMNDLRDTRKLGYRYSSLMKPRVAPARQQRFQVAMSANRATLGAAAAERVQAPAPDYLYVRDIKNLDQFPATTRNYGIFTAKVPAGTNAGTFDAFLGEVNRVLSGAHVHAEELSAVLDVTGKLPAKATTLELFIAPLSHDRQTTADAIPLVAESMTVIS